VCEQSLDARAEDRVPPHYKVVETSTVSDEVLETILNEWTGKGWTLESIQFAMRDASKRPSMAFVLFTRDAASED
jgi:hypothetical protein